MEQSQLITDLSNKLYANQNWVFYLKAKIDENVMLVLMSILQGLTFRLPWLIKIKLPGIEAELSQPTKSISSGPTGEINFGSTTSLINAGPQ